MRALFDINALIALFDPAHVHHDRAHQWMDAHRGEGWATCPITQNGCLRILSQPRYPNSISTPEGIRRLAGATAQPEHVFWADDLSIVDAEIFSSGKILGPGQLTDLYLLALAVRNTGQLVTFDRSVPISAVRGAITEHLVVLGGGGD